MYVDPKYIGRHLQTRHLDVRGTRVAGRVEISKTFREYFGNIWERLGTFGNIWERVKLMYLLRDTCDFKRFW